MSPPGHDAPPRQPLPLEPILLHKVWGGRRLQNLGKRLAPQANVGESWELCDLLETSASGAGGGALRSRIASGPLAGQPLADALAAWDLPRPAVLIKFLDAADNLSVQVHPSPAYARAHPGAHLKSECWLVLDALPDARIYAGLDPGVTVAEFARACRAGSNQVPGMLRAIPAIPGRCHVLPSGTVHALGAGVLVAEVQTPSDTTFRLHDWGRVGRELHVEQALEAMTTDAPPPARKLEPDKHPITTGAFTLWRRTLAPGATTSLDADRQRAWIITAGHARAAREDAVARADAGQRSTAPGPAPIPLPLGSTTYAPPAAAGWRLESDAGAEAIVVEW